MRVALAATLFAAPDLLLLDEPTNYLDLEGTLWLEDHLANYPRTVIVISHDRDLLDTSVDQILHLDRGKLTLYKGSYSSFEEQRGRANSSTPSMPGGRPTNASGCRPSSTASRPRPRKPVRPNPRQDAGAYEAGNGARHAGRPRDRVPATRKNAAPPIIAVDEVSVGYDPKQPILNRVTLRIDTDDRIALLGANGNGKSTLVKLLAGRLAPFSGKVIRAEKLSVGYFAQHQVDELNLDASPYDHIRKLMPDAPESKVRGRAGAIGFSGKAGDTLVKNLWAAKRPGCCWGLRLSSVPT